MLSTRHPARSLNDGKVRRASKCTPLWVVSSQRPSASPAARSRALGTGSVFADTRGVLRAALVTVPSVTSAGAGLPEVGTQMRAWTCGQNSGRSRGGRCRGRGAVLGHPACTAPGNPVHFLWVTCVPLRCGDGRRLVKTPGKARTRLCREGTGYPPDATSKPLWAELTSIVGHKCF